MPTGKDIWSREFGALIASLFVGAAGGSIAGFIVSVAIQGNPDDAYQRILVTTSTPSVTSATTTIPTSTLSLIPLERRAAAPLLPPAFLNRRISSVASMYRKPRVGEDRMLGADRMMGQAVAMTTDGWFVTAASVFDDARAAETVLWYDGASYPIERGVIDSSSGAAFIKIAASNLTPPAFARAQEISAGAELWVEVRPGEYAPSLALSTLTKLAPNDAVSSEQATRRVTVAGVAMHGDKGGAAWDPNGSLVGIADGKEGERLRLIPASNIATSFSSLLNRGRVVHAYLGVRAVDVASMRTDLPRENQPSTGALLRDDKRMGRLSVLKDSPAQGILKAGDVILRVERDILDGTADLGEVLADYLPGTQVTLRVWRDGQDLDLSVKLGEIVTGETLK